MALATGPLCFGLSAATWSALLRCKIEPPRTYAGLRISSWLRQFWRVYLCCSGRGRFDFIGNGIRKTVLPGKRPSFVLRWTSQPMATDLL